MAQHNGRYYRIIACYSRPNRHGFYSQAVSHALADHDGVTLCGRTPVKWRNPERHATNWEEHPGDSAPTCARCRKALGLEPGRFDPRSF